MTITEFLTQQKTRLAYYLLTICAILLFININIGSIANDAGYWYFLTTEIYLNDGLAAASQINSWPFYVVLIGNMVKITGLSIPYAAMLLNGLFYLLLIYSFVSLLSQLGGSRQVKILGCALLITLPILNKYLDYIISDLGYLAFLFFGFTQLLKFTQRPILKYCLTWSISVIIASLLRVEGLILMVITSLGFLAFPTYSLQKRAAKILLLNSPLILIIISVSIYLTYYPDILASINFTGAYKLKTWFLQVAHESYATYIEKSIDTANALSKAMRPEDMWLFFVGGFGLLFLVNFCSGFTLLNFLGLYGHARYNNFYTEDKRWWLIYWAIIVELLLVIFYVLAYYFLTTRYLLPLILTLLIPATFGLSSIINYLKDELVIKPLLVTVLILSAVYNIIDSVVAFGASKLYITDAAQWIKRELPKDANIFSNDVPVTYYSGFLNINNIGLIDKTISNLDNNKLLYALENQNYDYALINISYKNKDLKRILRSSSKFHELGEFKNERGDRIIIIRPDK